MKVRDPGYVWFHDYYERYTSEKQVQDSIRLGQVVSAPASPERLASHRDYLQSILYTEPVVGQLFVVVRVENDTITARTQKVPCREISFPIGKLVSPNNVFFALSFSRGKEITYLDSVASEVDERLKLRNTEDAQVIT
jgi:hypothetical protein